MKTGEWDLKGLSDDELLRSISLTVGNERRCLAQMVAHLAEVEERRLHLKIGCSSLFDYCRRRLGFSEGEAFRRLTASRLVRRFPMILRLLAEGDIHLCGLCELRDVLTQDNHSVLLAEASRKTKYQVKELVARHHPRPDVRSGIRQLPAPARVATEHLPSPAEEDATSPAPTAIVATASAPIPPPVRPVRATPSIVEPLREDRYRLQLNASAELKRKLERVRDLMSHTNPSGDLAVVVERALDLLIDKLERERFAQTTHPRKDAKPQPDKRRVSNATRREVVERDGLQCSYVSPEGERCPSRQFLQFHHELAWALGGKSDTPNSRIFCANHNKLRAEQDFGKERIAQVVATARTRPRKTIC
jgi:5-methylcytosine-specific restriction endonuclease McrA